MATLGFAGASLVACGSSGGSPGSEHDDGGTGNPGFDATGFYPDGEAPHADATTGTDGDVPPPSLDGGSYDALPPFPQVINDDGGILPSPVIVAIFFNNDDPSLLPSFKQFYMGLGASSMWQAATEYGIGPATTTIVDLDEAAPATIDDTPDEAGDNTALENWLLGEINASPSPLPAWTPNTTYLINYPATTKVTSDGDQCVEFDGYHSDFQNAAMTTTYSYGVIPRCTDMGSTTPITFTSTVSHEALEAATDPYPDYSPAWSEADNPHLFWDEANDGSEIADMCENDPEAYYQFSDFPFTVQRFWSNKSALAGHDPCVPEIAGKTFFNAVPELPDTGLFDYYGSTVKIDSVHIPVGASATVYLDLYSDGTLDDWDVQVFDYNYYFNTGDLSTALLTFDMPVTKGNNGSRLPLTVTVKTAGDANTNGQIDNTELFIVQSSQGLSETAPAHYWYGIVTN